ncbi:MAG: phosphate ABC transporter permease PstA [Deltaproteobacteria bacterium]|nr:phosphate ABC transporter permease PstA [Deltaproteobacteria bacterium]
METRSKSPIECVRATLARRNRAERRFRNFGRAAVLVGLAFLVLMFVNIISTGYSAFWQTYVKLPVFFDPQVIDPQGTGDPETLGAADYGALVKASVRSLFPGVKGRRDRRDVAKLVSRGTVFQLRRMTLEAPLLVGSKTELWVPANDDYDMLHKGNVDRTLPEADRRLSDKQIGWFDRLAAEGRVESRFNVTFFTAGDSREPELAGIWGAAMGSFFTLMVTLSLSFPLGVATAVYLEEIAPRNRLTGLIEVNINNLAAVPSIVFGLLGLAVFINLFGLPRSAPLVGGLVLTLMTLPTIIIAGRAALKSVPPSIREAALGVGASKMQMIAHHVLPLAMPGMLTGAIIGMARALGETAPLLMIGMVAFVVDVPQGVTDAATALPVQIFLWLDSPERAFVERASAAIMVLLAFLIVMNAMAVVLRRRFERRW